MIYTVTFNPALDYVMRFSGVETGSVNRANDEKIFVGGKGINVSLILKELGQESVALGFTAGFTGKIIEEELVNQGIKTDFVRLSQGFTRINVKVKAQKETDLNGHGPQITTAEIDSLFEKLSKLKSGDSLVLAGSVPDTLPEDMYERILSMLYQKNIRFVVDATGDLLMNVLKYEPFLIKPNNFELGEMFSVEIKNDEEIEKYAKKLQLMGAKNVLVSMAADGGILVDETGEVHRIGTVKGRVVNSVGAGDSMVAGFIAGYNVTKNYSYALKLGSASGSATAFTDWLAKKDEIFELLKKY